MATIATISSTMTLTEINAMAVALNWVDCGVKALPAGASSGAAMASAALNEVKSKAPCSSTAIAGSGEADFGAGGGDRRTGVGFTGSAGGMAGGRNTGSLVARPGA